MTTNNLSYRLCELCGFKIPYIEDLPDEELDKDETARVEIMYKVIWDEYEPICYNCAEKIAAFIDSLKKGE